MQSTLQHVLTATTTTTLLALSGCLAGCDRLPLASSALSQPVPASLQLSIAEDAKRDTAHRKHAVQALLTNLLDDAELPAFPVVDPALVCGEDSTVRVDGRPPSRSCKRRCRASRSTGSSPACVRSDRTVRGCGARCA